MMTCAVPFLWQLTLIDTIEMYTFIELFMQMNPLKLTIYVINNVINNE